MPSKTIGLTLNGIITRSWGILRIEKKQYFEASLAKIKFNQRLLWRKFRELNICATSSNNTIPDLLNVPDDINKVFSAFSTNTNSVDKNVINSYLNKTHPNLLHLFEFCSVTESTVKDSIINIKSSAAGVDKISLDMLLLCLNRIFHNKYNQFMLIGISIFSRLLENSKSDSSR